MNYSELEKHLENALDKVAERDERINKITKHKIEEWLKSSHTNEIDVDNAIEVIYELVSGQYSLERCRKDIISHYNNNWKYMEKK